MKFCARASMVAIFLSCIHLLILCQFFNKFKEEYNQNLESIRLKQFKGLSISVQNANSQTVLFFPRNIEKTERKNCNTELGFKTVLFYNEPEFMKTKAKKDAIYMDCEFQNCIISHNRSKLLTADAIIYYIGIRYERMGKYPPVDNKSRNPNQAWIFTTAEPPEHYYNTDFTLKSWQNTMNWSCLYRLDSDIPNPYGYLIRTDNLGMLDYDSVYEQKTKNALWIVSHCHVSSERRQFVLEMIRNGFDVDILGGCSEDGQKIDEVYLQQIIPYYKFFLAFENSLCIDYISEKYFNNFNYSWILIVRGGADYNRLLPKNTYINTAEFKDISSLVQYLLNLGNDRYKYINHLKTKSRYVSIRWPGNKHCEICRRINNLNQFRKSYADLDTYLTTNQCFRPKDIDKIFL